MSRSPGEILFKRNSPSYNFFQILGIANQRQFAIKSAGLRVVRCTVERFDCRLSVVELIVGANTRGQLFKASLA